MRWLKFVLNDMGTSNHTGLIISAFNVNCEAVPFAVPRIAERSTTMGYRCLFVLRFYGPVSPMGSCRARSVYLATRLLGRFSPLSG